MSSAAPPLPLRCPSAAPPLHLPCISPFSGGGVFELIAPSSAHRDLIHLALIAFRSPAGLRAIPIAPATSMSALHLAAVGGLSHPRVDGGASPASSMTSEQPSLPDVERAHQGVVVAPPGSAARPAAAAEPPKKSGGGLFGAVVGGRKLSFGGKARKK